MATNMVGSLCKFVRISALFPSVIRLHCSRSFEINDIHHAAVFGRPPHIHRDFCDMTPLTEEDLTDFGDGDESSSFDESKLYLVHLAELASRVGNCLIAKFSSVDDTLTEQKRYHELVDFEKTLTPSFRVDPPRAKKITLRHGFWPSLIHLYHCDYQIVFHRMLSKVPDNDTEDESGGGGSDVTYVVAGKINRALEDLLASGTLYRAPFMVFPAIFASILVHIIHIRQGDAHVQIIAEHRARLAMHILDNFQDAWPIVVWTRHLLDCLLKGPSLPAAGQGRQEWAEGQQRQDHSASQQNNTNVDSIGAQSASGRHSHQYHRPRDSFQSDTRHFSRASGGEDEDMETPPTATDEPSSAQRDMVESGFHSDLYQQPPPTNTNFHSVSLMFPLNNMLEDAGLSTDSWLSDYYNIDEDV
jgi:hypothetical protein